jgi:outer membrane protein
LLTGSLVTLLAAGTASADTLREALLSTYETNPTLTAQREALKSTDATVAIARAQGRPRVDAVIGVNRNLTRSGVIAQTQGNDHNISVSGGVDLSMPLFTGGRVKNSIQAAKTRVEAGRATLRGVEGDVFVDAVSAYMDVIRDRAIVELNENNVKVLETNLQATQDRFEIGDVTRTDVAQSQARLELGRANLATARGRASSSEQEYRRVIGHEPGQLAPPPPLPPLPATPDEAVRIALANNPDIEAVNRQAQAAGYDVRVARAQRLPTLSAVASGDYLNQVTGGTNGLDRAGTATSAGDSATIPIYQGGEPAARIRQAQALEGQTLDQAVGTERSVVAQTRSAFATYQSATDAISANEVAMNANELALEGARAERSVGTRTVLDVLNAEQELLNSQVALVTAKRDQYVAGFQLLNAMGQAEAQDLGLDGGPLYDPLGNYRRVANSWSDWAGETRHLPVATRTVSPVELPQQPAVTPQLVPGTTLTEPVVTSGVTPPQQ